MSKSDEQKNDVPQDATDDYMVWVDIETTGLEPDLESVLEVGYRITDLELHEIASRTFQIWDTITEVNWNNADSFVQEMHANNGLIDQCKASGMLRGVAETLLVEGLTADLDALHIKKPAMCGSSVQFDRNHLAYHFGSFESLFSYRNIDVSTVKELCRRFCPEVYNQLEKYTDPVKAHRAQSDLTDTINEFRFYVENFLFTTRGV